MRVRRDNRDEFELLVAQRIENVAHIAAGINDHASRVLSSPTM